MRLIKYFEYDKHETLQHFILRLKSHTGTENYMVVEPPYILPNCKYGVNLFSRLKFSEFVKVDGLEEDIWNLFKYFNEQKA